MERGSDKHGARMDEALEGEVHGMMQANRETHAEEWSSPEPSGEDQPDIDLVPDGTLSGGLPEGMTDADVEERSQLALYLGKEVWPATGAALLDQVRRRNAPDRVVGWVLGLDADREYTNLQDAWSALRRGVEQQRF